jgi:hypothetical protein
MLVGSIVGLVIPMWWGMGSFFYPNLEGRLPVSTAACEAFNSSTSIVTAAPYNVYVPTERDSSIAPELEAG